MIGIEPFGLKLYLHWYSLILILLSKFPIIDELHKSYGYSTVLGLSKPIDVEYYFWEDKIQKAYIAELTWYYHHGGPAIHHKFFSPYSA